MRIVSPHQSLLYAPVSGTVDADYVNDWLTDGRPGFPVQVTGALSLTVTPAAPQDVDVICLHHHNVREAATVTLGGDLSGAITTRAPFADNIFPNIFRLLSVPVSVSSLVLGISGNTVPVITSLYAGLSTEISLGFEAGRTFDPGKPFPWESTMAPNEDGMTVPRRLSGTWAPTDAEFAALLACLQAMRNGTRPALIIPDDTVNDAWLCTFQITEALVGGNHFVTIEIVEIPRIRW